jgi:hypothetical protein
MQNGSRYAGVDMKYWNGWYTVPDTRDDDDDWLWCAEAFGEPNPNGRWFYSTAGFYFKSKKDAMLFTLGWGQ